MSLMFSRRCGECGTRYTGCSDEDCPCRPGDPQVERYKDTIREHMRGMLAAAHCIAAASGCREAAGGFAYDGAEALIEQAWWRGELRP